MLVGDRVEVVVEVRACECLALLRELCQWSIVLYCSCVIVEASIQACRFSCRRAPMQVWGNCLGEHLKSKAAPILHDRLSMIELTQRRWLWNDPVAQVQCPDALVFS